MTIPNRAAEPVSFITVEAGDDLIVSFVISTGQEGEVASLTLLRTPKYEALLPPADRGVSVDHELQPSLEQDLLLSLSMAGRTVEIQTTGRDYLLDVSSVDPEELAAARDVLRRMNFDGRLGLRL